MTGVFEAGGTKTEFIFANGDAGHQRHSSGIHPMFSGDAAITATLQELVSGLSLSSFRQIYFYGASCASHEMAGKMKGILAGVFPKAELFVESDLLGTARALCGHQSGFAAILGTGSNACIFDGKEIGSRMVSFGFWLGDEGSGDYLGKMVFRAWLKGQLPPEIEWQAEEVFGCNRPSALQAILQDPKPNARMARLGGLAIRNKQLPFFAGIIEKGLNDFFDENRDLLESAKELPFHFSGSVAFHLQDEIKALLTSRYLMPGVFADRTAEDLFRYHQPLLPS